MSRRPTAAPEPRLAAFLRPGVYALVAAVLAYPLAGMPVVWSVAAGALLGAALAHPIARGRLRLPAVLAATLLSLVGLLWLRDGLLSLRWLAAWLGPTAALRWVDAGSFGLAAVVVSTGLRCAALRRPSLAVLEVAGVVFAFAQLVVAHRHGAINRPFALADSIIASGGDPSIALVLVGAAAVAAAVVLLMRERSLWRSLLHAALVALLLLFTRLLFPPPAPDASTGLNLTGGEPKDGKAKGDAQASGKQSKEDPRNDNEQLRFQNNYDSEGRQVPLAVVLLHDDYSPPSGMYYFRQTAFSHFNGRRLVASTRDDVDRDVAPRFVYEDTELADVPNIFGDRVELDTTVALLADHTRPFALESGRRLAPAANPDPGRFRRVYRASSSAFAADYTGLFGRELGDPGWNPEQWSHYTGPPPDARYGELANKVVAELPEHLRDDAVARALMVSLWLGREGTYSLKSGHAEAEDPTADFLFGDKVGYCVHFAHAAVYMMRSLGIPARVGAGYAVEEAARQGGSSVLLTGGNSHAWPEFYVAGSGWVIADVTPAQSLDPPPPPPDPDLQRLLGEMARGLDPIPLGGQRPFEPAIQAARDSWAALGPVLGWGIPALLLLMYLIKLWRRTSPRFSRTARLPRALYRAQLDRLGEARLRRRFGESREAFASRVADRCPSFAGLTSALLARDFAASSAPDASHLRATATKARHELTQAVSWRRRTLGLINPWSWIASR